MLNVLGSINVDLVARLPRLPAVGETVLTAGFMEAVGGKGANQAIAAARDGAGVRLVGAVGRDAFGATALAALGRSGVDVSGIERLDGPTGVAFVWVDGEGRNKIAVASGANAHVGAAALERLALRAADTLVLQMEVPADVVAAAIARARDAGMRIILNLAPATLLAPAVLADLDILVVNEVELEAVAGGLGLSAADHTARAAAVARRLGITVIATLGAEGAVAANGDDLLRVPPLPVAAVDTTGAGDCFVGVLAAGLDGGAGFADAMRRAAVAASLACTVPGAEPSFPTRAAIDAALARSARGAR